MQSVMERNDGKEVEPDSDLTSPGEWNWGDGEMGWKVRTTREGAIQGPD